MGRPGGALAALGSAMPKRHRASSIGLNSEFIGGTCLAALSSIKHHQSLDKTRGIFSLGVVARDRLGKLSWARAKCYNGSIEPKTTETLAIIDGVNSAVSENLNLSLWNPTLSMLLTFVQVVPCLNARWSILFKMSMILLGRVPTISLYVSRTDLVIQLTIVLLCGL
ncbi:hypothetical protein LWI28_022264 [Acer negundo]|uniref:Uncharacterized protein n=1 Tax=Acer negundo TaxID=4023 RepID=A0AAD5NSQ7_ACENE|nr:hypothetical protein LWI28_022264 [Acer negundo]